MSQINKPLSPHWADIAAHRVIVERGDKDQYTVASGITPSGVVHVGNFREVITGDFVARALRARGKDVRFIYSWDNFDTFRKVPKNLPEGVDFSEQLRKPIARIPDPWGQAASYARGREERFEAELAKVGIMPEFISQEERYSSGGYAAEIRFILENLATVRSVLNKFRTSPLADSWLPSSIYCEKCSTDKMEEQRYDGAWQYSYVCASCGHRDSVDIRTTRNLKLNWRVDWPMRWHFEGVDFEPGGKDHSSEGGSYDTAKELINALWQTKPPSYLQYDFVMIKGKTGKMSSSSGELYTVDEVLSVYEPQILRWIFASQRPNHDFAIAFDADVFRIYDEFDSAEALALGPKPEKKSRWDTVRRSYELSLLDGSFTKSPPKRAKFRVLCNRLQLVDNDIDRCFEKFYADELGEEHRPNFVQRAERALVWLSRFAAEEFCYTLRKSPAKDRSLGDEKLLAALRALLLKTDLETIDDQTLNKKIWDELIKTKNLEAKQVFKTIYTALIGRSQGPRLPSFLREIGKERLLKIL